MWRWASIVVIGAYGLYGFVCTGDAACLLLVYANILGATLGVYYTSVYRRSCDSEKGRRRLTVYLRAVCMVACAETLAVKLLPARALSLLGCVSTLSSVSVCLAPLLTVRNVLKTRSVVTMPADLALASLLAAALWVCCGALLADGFVVVTNLVNLGVSLVSLSFIVRFHAATRWLWEAQAAKVGAAHADDIVEADSEDLARQLLGPGLELQDMGAGMELGSLEPRLE